MSIFKALRDIFYVCNPESISHTLSPWTRNTGYEIGPAQDPLDYPPKAERG